MKTVLYPLKFEPILKERIWGGEKLYSELNKPLNGRKNIGESWELSGVEDDVSVV
ncbi:MAG: mannose-6-phosphate isomerase, partial [Bacteroidales bacterium]|nr:mannose-6-phosphate isomerase [Bacteroidales bacterium]